MVSTFVISVAGGCGIVVSMVHALTVYASFSRNQHSQIDGVAHRPCGKVPFHFACDGSPSMFLSWKCMGLYPALVALEAAMMLLAAPPHLDKELDADRRQNTSVFQFCTTDRATIGVAMVLTIVAQVWAAKIATGEQTKMPCWLPKALVAAVCAPCLARKLCC